VSRIGSGVRVGASIPAGFTSVLWQEKGDAVYDLGGLSGGGSCPPTVRNIIVSTAAARAVEMRWVDEIARGQSRQT